MLSGTNTFLRVGYDGLSISGDSLIIFRIGKEPFQIAPGSAVIDTRGFVPCNNVSAEHPYTIKIDASENRKGGTFTLIKSRDIDFRLGDNVVWDYDPGQVELTVTAREVIAHVKNREGTKLLMW